MLNPELEGFLEAWNQKWSTFPQGGSIPDRRAHFEKIADEMRLPMPDGVDDSDVRTIKSAAGNVRVRIYRPAGDAVRPCLIYMHGGAWMQGSPETHGDITSRIAAWAEYVVVSVDYALAPEHPFPTAVNQCADVVRWVASEAKELGVDENKIVVGGDSAGANIAASLTLIFKEEKGPNLLAQLLVYPPVDFEQTRPAYIENAEAPLLQTKGMKAVNAMYFANEGDSRHPYAAPFLASDHTGLPPAYIAVAENDPLRDDGIDYAQKLSAADVDVILDKGEGLIHGYLRAMEYCKDTQNKLHAMCDWLVAKANV